MTQKIAVVYSHNQELKEYCRQFYTGMLKHSGKKYNIMFEQSGVYEASRHNADLLVFWSHREDALINYQKMYGRRYLVLERGFIDRTKWVSAGYDGINGTADFCNANINSSNRWFKYYNDRMQDWKRSGEYALVIGQTRFDVAVLPQNIEQWYTTVIRKLNEKGIPVVFRPHPKEIQKWEHPKLKYTVDKNKRIEDTLKNAKFTVTYSSNSGVDSIIAGVPTVSYNPHSMVYNISANSLDEKLRYCDRQLWANRLAYSQWSPKELESGETWEHIKSGFERP